MVNGSATVTGTRFSLGRLVWPLLGVVDAALWVVVIYGSTLLRLDLSWARLDAYAAGAAALGAAALQLLVGYVVGIYRGRYRLGSFEEAGSLAVASLIVGTVLLVAGRRLMVPFVPTSALVAAIGYQLAGALAYRYILRSWRDQRQRSDHQREHRALIFGAGQAGYWAAKALQIETESDMEPVAFLDDDAGKKNLRLTGLPVGGSLQQLEEASRRFNADTLLVAMPSAPRERVNEVADAAQALGLTVRLVPPLTRLIGGSPRISDIHEITLADFLSRDEIELEEDAIRRYLRGKRVLVTGAGGSIGSQICTTVQGFEPAALYKLDHSERSLYELEMALEGRFVEAGETILADVRDRARIRQVFDAVQPEVVFHAAAHKHVPFLEANPSEGYLTNVVGTQNVLTAAEETGVDRFVNVSTDKAADPVNVLGYTKRLAELLTAAVARRVPGTFMSVRFGNVLGSDGSVITTFREQLRRGEPLTITHPDVTRYFMTIPEAVQLVLEAGAVGESGDVLVLDMGDPVRIVDLATRLAAELSPGTVPDFEYVGLRPGEKMSESLVSSADAELAQPHPFLFRFQVPDFDPDILPPAGSFVTADGLRTLATEAPGGTWVGPGPPPFRPQIAQ